MKLPVTRSTFAALLALTTLVFAACRWRATGVRRACGGVRRRAETCGGARRRAEARASAPTLLVETGLFVRAAIEN